jgi:hypothetical protein
MESLANRLDEYLLELLWGSWAELGVSGWARRHTEIAIDPEPLILFTAVLTDADPRLSDETTDWCIKYGRYISGARLRNLLRSKPPEVHAAFGTYAATVRVHGGPSWLGATEPRPYRPTKRSSIEHFDRAALVSLRLRGLFGVSARAELLRIFLADPQGTYTAAELAIETSFTRRSVADALEALMMSGLLRTLPVRNQLVYELVDPLRLLDLVGDRPLVFPRWDSLFNVLYEIRQTVRQTEDSSGLHVRAIEARNLLQVIERDLHHANLAAPSVPKPSTATWNIWPGLEEWILHIVADLASGDAGRYLALMPRQRRMPITFLDQIERLAAVSPSAAVIEACRQVERAIHVELGRSSANNIESIGSNSLTRMAVAHHLLSPSEAGALRGLIELRNRTVHDPSTDVDIEAAIEAGRVAYQLIIAIGLARGRPNSVDQILERVETE